jgi:CHC2 zinc finger
VTARKKAIQAHRALLNGGKLSYFEERGIRRFRSVSYVTPITAAKEAVSIIDLADKLTGPGGPRRRCPLPGHEYRSPPFVLYPQTASFFCYGCLRGGDVVELYRLVQGYSEREAHVAAANLLMEFGHEVPQRPPAWFRKQERQRYTRAAIEETKKSIGRRRLFQHLILPYIDTIEDERNQELDRAWADFKRLIP